jgi:hypothetical protein
MNDGKMKLRVYSRLHDYTIILWNNSQFTQDQKDNYSIYIRKPGDENWIAAQVEEPDRKRMKQLSDGTVAKIIRHVHGITEHTPMEIKAVFGKQDPIELQMLVEPRGAHEEYVRPIKLKDGTRALPVVIVGDLRNQRH